MLEAANVKCIFVLLNPSKMATIISLFSALALAQGRPESAKGLVYMCFLILV